VRSRGRADTERTPAGDTFWSPTPDARRPTPDARRPTPDARDVAQTRVNAFKELLLVIDGLMTWENGDVGER